MSSLNHDLARWNRFSIGLGAAVWALLTLFSLTERLQLNALDLILLLAFLVITPLALPLVSLAQESDRCGTWWVVILLQPFVAVIAALSFLLSAGPIAAAAAAVWFLYTGLIALLAMRSLLHFRRPSIADVCPMVALMYLPIGGAWLVIARLSLRPLGFSPDIVLLTAIHFHYVTLAALIMTGHIGRAGLAAKAAFPWKLYRVAAIGMLVEPLLVAAGQTLAQLTGDDYLQSVSATLLALTLMLTSLLSLRFVVPATVSRLAQGLLLLSCTAVLFTMLAVLAYALGVATGSWTITISQMIALHGWINALVFSLCGLVGWRLRLSSIYRKDG